MHAATVVRVATKAARSLTNHVGGLTEHGGARHETPGSMDRDNFGVPEARQDRGLGREAVQGGSRTGDGP